MYGGLGAIIKPSIELDTIAERGRKFLLKPAEAGLCQFVDQRQLVIDALFYRFLNYFYIISIPAVAILRQK